MEHSDQDNMGAELLQTRLGKLLAAREPPKTICPSEVPRSLSKSELDALNAAQWRDLMPAVRRLLWEMRDRGEVEILQKGAVLPPDVGLDEVKGPIRARRIS